MSPDLSYLTLFTAIANFSLGAFVLSKGKRLLNISFFVFTTIDALWAFTNFYFEKFDNSLFIFQSQYATGGLTLFAAIIWISYLLNANDSKRKIALYSILGVIVFFTPFIDGLVINSITESAAGNFSFIKGPLFDVYGAILFLVLTIMLYQLIRAERRATGLRRVQLRYVLVGILIFAAVAISFGLIFPLFGYNSIVAFDAQSSSLWVVLTTYAIIRHRLLDIKAVITRSLVYAILVSLVALSFVLILFISAQFFGGSVISRNVEAFFIAIIIVLGLDPLKHLLSRVTDKIFFQAKIEYAELLQRLSSIISLELNLQKLIDDLEKDLIQGLKVKSSLILLRGQDNGKTKVFRATYENEGKRTEIIIDNDSQLIKFVREHRHLSLLEALERKIEDTPEGPLRKKEEASREEFLRLGVALVAPIFSEDHLVAVLTLGPKLSGDSFSNEDTQLIEVLAPQIGSAIQKANLYEEVRQFGANLEIKVKEATETLEERNLSLQTLQNITREITRTLDFNRVAQNIANSIATELGYLGAILVLLDDDGHTSRARAVTETTLTKRAMKLLPKHYSEYPSDLEDPKFKNLEATVLRTGKVQISDHISDIVSPPLPLLMANTLQKMLGIGTIMVIPIMSEEKVIGVIEVGTKRKRAEVTDSEIATLQSVADELGVVARNIKLFEQIRQVNAQLEVANQHLQELDRAKSEFVSIASHQLRTPMTGIMGYLSMMTQGDFGKIKPEHQKILIDLLAESQRMIRLINQFLNVSKIEAGKFTYTKAPVQLATLVEREMKELNKAATDKGLKLVNGLPAKRLPAITVDADKLQDVILNLIDNAIKYTDKGTITISAEQQADQIHFWVKDTGIGIKPADASSLFSKFVRGSGIAQIHPDGSGLGLFIAKSIVDAHGGRIWAESEGEGKGSTFQFIIPITPPPDTTGLPSPSAAALIGKPRPQAK